ncbi:hypothetical protein C2G38_2200623 [Gigaspora rosea]|uniref:Uncharacterized protein n=1 Tax=Gigaspora rosea TaxID=44941 RepID=A0A397UQG1_9GLOM|nr:hypothetical protein C2G38_2200623 [Gigaspora rosea]
MDSKYVSEINLAALAIKYTIARSKLIIDIDSHITSGGGYTKFINWIESLAIKPKLLPDGFLILAFDNEQKASSFQQTVSSKNINKTIVFRPYEPKKPSIELQKSKISITQRNIINQDIKIPDLYIPDPISINPNSLINVQKILEHIEIITGIKSGKCKWIPVVCDGVPYNQALKLKQKFPWLILLPGTLHKEMNMLKSFVELNCIRVNMAICFKTSNGYLEWAKKQTNEIQIKPQIRETIENILVISHLGLQNQHQGLDAIIEEIYKALKSLIPPVPSRHWKIAARNYINFLTGGD